MAKKVIIADDIDGTADASSYSFALNGEQFEIDLSEANFKKLQDALTPFMEAGAKVTSRLPRSGGATKSASNKEELQAIRLWAKDNGYEVSDRGRVSQSIQDAYRAAH